MNFKKLMTICMTLLGIPSFTKNDAGAFTLSEDERKKIESAFGKEFTDKFEKQLSSHKEDINASTNPADATEDNGDDLLQAARNHHATSLAAGLKDLQTQLAQVNKEKAALQQTVATLSASAEENPPAEFSNTIPRKEGVASVMKVNLNHKHYAGVTNFLQRGYGISAAATIEVDELKSEFGTFLNTNRNNLDIIREIVTGFTSSKYFTSVPATTEYRAIRAFITSVVQQFTNKWTPLGKVKFTPLTVVNRRHKINYPIVPSEVLDSYMFMLYDEGLSPDQMPITKYIWNTLLYPQILQDIELRMAFKGKYVPKAFDSTTPGVPEDSMDGLETILVDAKVSGDKGVWFFNKFPNYDYRTATDDEVLAFFEAFVDWISPLYKTQQMNIFVSADHLTRYQRAYKNKWGQNSGQSGDFGTLRVDYSLNTLVALDGMYGSPIVFSTPKQNMLKLRHKNEVPNVINNVQIQDYEVKLFGEFWLAVGFAIGEAVFSHVPGGYDPKAQIAKNWGAATDYQTYHYDDGSSGSAAGGI